MQQNRLKGTSFFATLEENDDCDTESVSSVLKHVAVFCSLLQSVAIRAEHDDCDKKSLYHVDCSVLQYVAVCCRVLQCVVVCCSVLQCVAECSVLQCVVT